MAIRELFRRLRRALSHDKGKEQKRGKDRVKVNGREVEAVQGNNTTIATHPGLDLLDNGAGDGPRTITRADMQHSASDQDSSIFFSRLPLELRRQVYREVWRTYLKPRRVSPSSPGSDLRLHIYTDGSGRGPFRHTQCRVHPGAPVQDDAQAIEPFDSSLSHLPPVWFWFAWVMRVRWDKHWKCQDAIMKRWDPRTGHAHPAEPSPFLAVFLTCKKMYWEAVVSLFETITPVFTSSEDAYRFFLQRPHPFSGSIRSLEFSFAYPNDHLFLAQVQRDPREDAVTTSGPGPAAANPNPCMVMPSRLAVIGRKLWVELVQGVQTTIPDLRDFDITIGGRMVHGEVLAGFRLREADDDADDGATGDTDARAPPWVLPGKLAVFFKTDEQRYVQDGTKMIRQ